MRTNTINIAPAPTPTVPLFPTIPKHKLFEEVKNKNAPQRRKGHTSVSYKDSMIVFGGHKAKREYLNDIHIYNH